MQPKLVEIYPSNFREVVPTMRRVVDEIEAGKYGEVGSCALVVLGDRMEVFGMGPDSEAPSIALLLHAAFMRLSRAVEEHDATEE